MMIGYADYMMGRDREYPPTLNQQASANVLLQRVEALLYDLGIEVGEEDLASGYRPGKYNVAAGGSPNSAHTKCQAIDIKETSQREISSRITEALLEKHGLYMEHPDYTVEKAFGKEAYWVHLQTRPTKKRIFIPY